MFKVGDRVWVIDDKKYATITAIEKRNEYNTFIYIDIDNDNYKGYWRFDCQLRQTAQTMFEALGYEYNGRYDNDDYVTTVYSKVKDGLLYRIGFHEDSKKYSLSCSKDGDVIVTEFFDFENITTQLHLAIHQQLIEKGWIK